MRRIVRTTGVIAGAMMALAVTGAAAATREGLRSDWPRYDWPETQPHASYRVLPPRAYAPPRIQFTQSRAVYRLPKGLDGLATLDPALSRLCQRGAFLQTTDRYFWALTPDRPFGVAFAGGASLEDPQGRRQAGKVYFFSGQDSRCAVYVGDQAKLKAHYIEP